MLLIVILILSQDQGFSQSIQGVTLASVPWYKERTLQKTSLGTPLHINFEICFLITTSAATGQAAA